MSKLNASAKEWTPPTSTPANNVTSLRTNAQPFVPSSAVPTAPQVAQQAYAAPMYGYYSTPYYPNYGDYYSMPVPIMYDPNLLVQQQQLHQHQQHQQQQHYDGHKSRSNSLTHQSEFSASATSTMTPTTTASAASATSDTAATTTANATKFSGSLTGAKVVEPAAGETVQGSAVDKITSSSDSTAVPTKNESTESTSTPEEYAQNGDANYNHVDEGKSEGDGWQRGRNLAAEVHEKQPSDVPPPDAGPSPWKRGISMSEKTPAQMLLRQDGIIRYGRDTIISLHVVGANPVPDFIVALYGQKLTSNERNECKPLTGPAPKSPNKNRRDNKNRREEVVEEPHPDEKTIFHTKNEAVFRYDPNRVVDTSSPDAVIHKATEILNKLSVDSFERLSDQFLNIGMETEEIMGRVVDLIVSKAQMEEHFCFMYADLCKKITEKWVSEDVAEDQGGGAGGAAGGGGGATTGAPDLGKTFRVRLLERCQEEFQQDREAAMQAVRELQIPEEDKEEKLFVLKKRYTGHMRFVGEIYMKDLLKPAKVYMCIEDLLKTYDEEKLSCLCKLMQTIGKKLEAYDAKKKKGKLQDYFQTISKLAADKGLSTKVRFGFQDLIEMRGNNWTARRVEEKAKKLSEIRGDGPSGPSSGQGPTVQFKTNTPRSIGAQDARVMSSSSSSSFSSSPTVADDWNVVSGGKGKKGPPPKNVMTPGRGGGAPLQSSMKPNSNQFSALSSTSQRSTKVKNRSRDEEDGKRSASSNHPQVSIPQTSSISTFSPSAESPSGGGSVGGGEVMSPLTRENSEVTIVAPGADGFVDEVMTARIIATMNEYFLNDLLDEAIFVMKESVHPNACGEAVRILIRAVLEKKDIERRKFNIFLPELYTSGLLSKEQCIAGISSFLHDFDDIVVDVPLVADYVASILSALYLKSAIDDLSFALHLPDENNFSLSMNQYTLIIKTAVFIEASSDDATAKKFFTGCLEGRSIADLNEMDKEQVEKAIEKYQATFLA